MLPVPPATARAPDSANWQKLCALQIFYIILYCIALHAGDADRLVSNASAVCSADEK